MHEFDLHLTMERVHRRALDDARAARGRDLARYLRLESHRRGAATARRGAGARSGPRTAGFLEP